MWAKYITRRLAVQVAQAWNFGWGEAMEKVYGLSVRNTLVFRDNKKTEYYVDDAEHKKYVAGLYALLENDRFIKVFHGDSRKVLEFIQKDIAKKVDRDLSKLTNKALLEIYQKCILPGQTQFYIRMWTVFNIGEPLADVVSRKLREHVGEKRAEEYLLSLSSPLVPNDVLHERISLLRLAIAQKNGGRVGEKELMRHGKQFRHIPMFDFDHEPYGIEYFKRELKLINNPESELGELNKQFSERKGDFDNALKVLKPDASLKKLLVFLKENVFLRDYRDMIRQKLNLSLRMFYTEVAGRLHLSLSQVATLTNDEIIKHLLESRPFPHDEVAKRERSFLLIQQGSKADIYSGDGAISKAREELGELEIDTAKILKGITGAKGKAQGPVRLVFTNRDLDKVHTGDVLVATMTRQDFVPAIRKAVALVTDEGSVTAHAAIIARELKVPCVVATKIGTQVLKDGDLVEVDADNGIIRVIKRKN